MRIGKLGWTTAAIALLVGCGGEEAKPDTAVATAVSAEDGADVGPEIPVGDIRWRSEKYRELDGDEENPERLVATASGTPWDSLKVRFEIRTSKDAILYRHEWPADSYLKYADDGAPLDSTRVLAETRKQLNLIFADSQFITGSATASNTGQLDVDIEAIRHDLAEHQYRTTKKLARWSPISGSDAWADINDIAKTIPLTRLNAIAAETRDKPAFRYWAGGEETYVVAWSPTEKRMVRIAACC